MLRLLFLAILFSALCMTSTMAEHEPKAKKKLTIAADYWCPINCDPSEENPGIGIDMARWVFKPLGYEINYVLMPWSRALEEVKAGKIDAIVGANSTDEPNLIFPETPIYPITDDFYIRRGDSWRFTGMDSLKGKRLGTIRDYGYSPKVEAYIAAHRRDSGIVQEVYGDKALEQNIQKLLAGRIDILLESRAVMEYTLYRKQLQEQIEWAGGVPQGPVYLAFSPSNPKKSAALARKFDAAMQDLRSQPTYRERFHAYGLHPPLAE